MRPTSRFSKDHFGYEVFRKNCVQLNRSACFVENAEESRKWKSRDLARIRRIERCTRSVRNCCLLHSNNSKNSAQWRWHTCPSLEGRNFLWCPHYFQNHSLDHHLLHWIAFNLPVESSSFDDVPILQSTLHRRIETSYGVFITFRTTPRIRNSE